jgi:hypothetical protein
MQPLSVQSIDDINNENLDGTKVLWTALVDDDFLVEVHRDSEFEGTMYIFEILYSKFYKVWEVSLVLDVNTPTLVEINAWQNVANDAIDYYNADYYV